MHSCEVRLTQDALADVQSLKSYLTAERGEAFGGAYVSKLTKFLRSLERAPMRGTVRQSIRPGLRVIGWRRAHTIAFIADEATHTVTVLAVLSRGQDIGSILQSRTDPTV